jgi:hypothetical protein
MARPKKKGGREIISTFALLICPSFSHGESREEQKEQEGTNPACLFLSSSSSFFA